MDLRTVIRDRRHAHLVHRARRGDRKAYRALFVTLHDPVHAYLDRRCDDPYDTEDLVSTVFHKLLSNLGTFDPGRGSVTGWVMTMARHAEAASLTGLTEAAVRQRLSRAVKQLRERVAGDLEPEGEVDYAIR